ncbi:MAG: Ig-like domain-containing protein [Streptosporangiaceae bacterium]
MKQYIVGAVRSGSRLVIITAAGAALVLSAAACSVLGGHSQPPPAAQLTITPASGVQNVSPSAGVTVTAKHGKLRNVVVRAIGDPLAGLLSRSKTAWHSEGLLYPSHTYTVTATAIGAGGKRVTVTSTFQTLKPRKTFSASIIEGYQQSYGVGMPIVLTFNRPITHKAAVESSLSLVTSKPVVGAWYWDGNETLEFRPRVYWPQHTVVSVKGDFKGVEAARGVYGIRNVSQTFNIGASLIVVASTTSHYMQVYYKHRLFGDWPISTGRPGDDTANGTYLTIEKANPTFMTGPGYALWVPWAVRFTWSGVYIHDAYWSVGEQGYVNVSHGCVNTSPEHAEIYYNMELPGDPVTVTNSPVAGTWDNGWTEWFLSWKQLLKGSALHEAVEAGPNGSSFVSPATLPAVQASVPLQRPRFNNAA